MIGFDSYIKTAFEIFIESRVRSFLFVKMYKLIPLFSLLENDKETYEEFIEKSRWFEAQPPRCSDGTECPDGDCSKCTADAPKPPTAAQLEAYDTAKGAYFGNLKELRKAEEAMRGWYYSWPRYGPDQYNGGKNMLEKFPWAKNESNWKPPGATKKCALGEWNSITTTPRDPENKYNKLKLWKSKLSKFWNEIDGWTDEEKLTNWAIADFTKPVADATGKQLMHKCNVFYHFLETHIGAAVSSGANDDDHHTLRWWCAEGEGAEGLATPNAATEEAMHHPAGTGETWHTQPAWDRCDSSFKAAESDYIDLRNIIDGSDNVAGSAAAYKAAAKEAGKTLSAGFMGLLEQNGVFRLYNLAAYVVAVGAGRETAESKEKIAENMMKEIFLRVFERNMEAIKTKAVPTYGSEAYYKSPDTYGKGKDLDLDKFLDKIFSASNKLEAMNIVIPDQIEYKLGKYNIMIDDAIYSMIEPIK